MSTIVSRHRGGHVRRRRKPPAPPPDGSGLILAEAADAEGMTLGELRAFLDRAELAAWEAGESPAGLRWRVYVRKSGYARGISVRTPDSWWLQLWPGASAAGAGSGSAAFARSTSISSPKGPAIRRLSEAWCSAGAEPG